MPNLWAFVPTAKLAELSVCGWGGETVSFEVISGKIVHGLKPMHRMVDLLPIPFGGPRGSELPDLGSYAGVI